MTVTPWLAALITAMLPLLAPAPTAPPAQSEGTPEIRLEATEEDHGKHLQGEVYAKKLKVFNDGTATLNIPKVLGSCGCIEIVNFPKTIEAGGEGEIEYEVHTKKIRPGDSLKEIRVHSDDPYTAIAKYRFNTEVINLFRTNPNPVVVSGVMDHVKEATVDIFATTDLGLEILDLKSRDGKFQIVDSQLIAKDKQYRAKLQVGPATEHGKDRGILDLTIRVRDGRTVEIGTWVEIEHRPHILVQPVEMFFNNKDTNKLLVKEPKPVTKQIMVAATLPDTKFAVTNITVEGVPEGVFTTEFKTLVEGSRYQILVTLSAYQKKTYLAGKLFIETDDARFAKIELPLRAMFGRRVRR